MAVGPLRVDRAFLESRIARRLFAVFAACSLLPVLAFASFSYRAVREQLDRDAASALHRTGKAAGMAILERLLLADHELRLATEDALASGRGSGRALRSVTALDPDARRLAGLDAREIRHLKNGFALLQTSSGVVPTLELLRYREPGRPAAGAWLAEVDPAYLLAGERQAGGGRLWLTSADGHVIRESIGDWTPSERIAARPDAPVAIDGEESLVASWELFLASNFLAPSWEIFVSQPVARVHGPLREFEVVFPWIAGITLFGALALSLVQLRRTLVPIAALTKSAKRMGEGDFDARVAVETSDEFGMLSASFNEMADVVSQHVSILSLVNQVGAALSAERETNRVVDLILEGSMEATAAQVGAIYLASESGPPLLAKVQREGDPFAPGCGLAELLPHGVAARCLAGSGATRLERAATLDDAERDEWRAVEAALGTPLSAYLTVPMWDERRENLGVLLLVRAGSGDFTGQQCALAESLASQGAVTIRKNQLVESFRKLFEGLIELTVGAIDEKSAYTGDHCRNVPIITELIADVACDDSTGPFKDFDLSAEERYELRIAALLHDCGKVVTPVHVMDKATKLETITDRIHLVETRFELLRRDATIRSLARQIHASGAQIETHCDAALSADLAALEDDFAFLVGCNQGAERMPDDAVERVRRIAKRHTWVNRRDEVCDALTEDERTNLVVQRGTLNDEERKIIEHHVVATTKLLERLPFPKDLRQVPAIAGAHHEKMDGTGYPLRLRADQLSVQARILGLADVFEALTAKDRPYKPGRTLRETLAILERMGEEGHIDPDLLEVFLREKVHLRYAVDHLSPEQIDPEFQAELEELTGP